FCRTEKPGATKDGSARNQSSANESSASLFIHVISIPAQISLARKNRDGRIVDTEVGYEWQYRNPIVKIIARTCFTVWRGFLKMTHHRNLVLKLLTDLS